jgi:hypothetical protein
MVLKIDCVHGVIAFVMKRRIKPQQRAVPLNLNQMKIHGFDLILI